MEKAKKSTEGCEFVIGFISRVWGKNNKKGDPMHHVTLKGSEQLYSNFEKVPVKYEEFEAANAEVKLFFDTSGDYRNVIDIEILKVKKNLLDEASRMPKESESVSGQTKIDPKVITPDASPATDAEVTSKTSVDFQTGDEVTPMDAIIGNAQEIIRLAKEHQKESKSEKEKK